MRLFPEVVNELEIRGGADIPVLGGGVIPEEDIDLLLGDGLSAIFTPGTPASIIIQSFTRACQQHRDHDAQE